MAERPDLATEEGRLAAIRHLNEHLPRKRLIAQGLLRDAAGAVLLCELTYKAEWDLPGGVVDPGEGPARCLEREVDEELGLAVTAGDLLVVDWLPPYRGWDDALLLLFDLGRGDAADLDPAQFLPREIKGVHWCPPEQLVERMAPYAAELVVAALGVLDEGRGTAYLEPRVRGGER